ncbi:alpha/beta hydrolase [Alphaproteobacteria bacterium]|nr:alpha/beta hydrolase [Alphaproteobacteria bacterium]
MNATLVFIPCHMGSATVFKDQIAHFEKQYPVHVADTMSHNSINGMAEAALGAVSGAVIPIGLSMGGYVAMEMLYLAAKRLAGLVIMDSNPHAESETRRKKRLAEHDLINHGRYVGMTRAGVRQMISETHMQNADLVERIITMAKEPGQHIYETQMHAIINRRDYAAALSACPCPALIMYGSEDKVTPPTLHHDMQNMIPRARLIELPDTGHLITMEEPQQVIKHLDVFLAELKYQA